jgi:diaminopimelate decarboxylase
MLKIDAGNQKATTGKLTHSWLSGVDLKSIVKEAGTPVFVYSEEQLRRNVHRITAAAAAAGLGNRVELYVPFFPNSNPHVLRPLQDMGVGLLLQVPGEYEILQKFGFDRFIVSPGHISDDEIAFWSRTAYPTFLSSVGEVEYALHNHAPSISVRIDSLDSGKPGVKYGELETLSELLRTHRRDLECFEVYCGSGNSREDMIDVIKTMFAIFNKYFPTARSVNFAGGHGFVYESWNEAEKHFDWAEYLRVLADTAKEMGVPEHVRFLFEPARDVLADTGVLVLGVKRDVISNPISHLVVTDGSRMLMPSAQLRNRRHNVLFLDQNLVELTGDSAGMTATLRGRTILRHDYILPGEYPVPEGVEAGCHMVIFDVGAYCATQHMEFLNVPPTAEVLVDIEGTAHLITSRGGDLDKWRNLLFDKQPLCRCPTGNVSSRQE